MRNRTIRATLWAAAVLLVLGTGAPSTLAREGVYVGVGALQQEVSGDLDGTSTVSDSATGLEFRQGELNKGRGYGVELGYGVNTFLGAELLYLSTAHTATYRDSAGSVEQDARLNGWLVGARGNFPVGGGVELFGRLGLGGYSLKVDDNAFPAGGAGVGASAPLGSSTFTGSGMFYGLGVHLTGGGVGVELASLYHSAAFDRYQHGNRSGDLSPEINIDVVSYLLLLTYHFQ